MATALRGEEAAVMRWRLDPVGDFESRGPRCTWAPSDWLAPAKACFESALLARTKEMVDGIGRGNGGPLVVFIVLGCRGQWPPAPGP
ncbi:unnamed protein product [Gadus morhua 'NCC']